MATKTDKSPLDDARAAFDRLGMPDKTAFVLESAFRTIGQAVSDAGEMVAEAVSSFDASDPFCTDAKSEEASDEPEKATGAASKPRANRAAPRKPKGGTDS